MRQVLSTGRRAFVLGAATSLCAKLTFAQSLDSSKPLRIVVPYPPGGAVDAVARILAEKLPERLAERSVVVENRPGAGGNIAEEAVARSAPDGATILVTSNNHTINPSLYRKAGYDPHNDFVSVAGVADAGFIILAHPGTGLKTLDDMIKAARAKPDSLSFGSGGNGHPAHLATELLKSKAKISMLHVPYKGSGPLMTDLIGGQLPIAVGSIAAAQPFVKSGKLNALAVTSIERWPGLPDVPTVAESGYPGFDYTGWIGILAPRGTPAEFVADLQKNIMAIAVMQDIRNRLYLQGMIAKPMDGVKLSGLISHELTLNRDLIRKLGLQID